MFYWLQNMDDFLLMEIQSIHNSVMDVMMPLISAIADHGVIWFLIAALLLIKKDYRKYSFMIIISMGVAFVIGELILKPLVGRARPCHINEWIPLLIQAPDSFSFPSGHTASSFTAATILYLCNRKWGIIAFVLAGMIAFSRMYLYVHYPTDILAGIVLGIFSALLVYWTYKKLENRNQKKQTE